MSPTGTEYHFSLSRRQRLINFHDGSYRIAYLFLVFNLILFGLLGPHSIQWHWLVLAVLILFWCRNDLYWYYRLITVAEVKMCLSVNEKHISFGEDNLDWVMSVDGIINFSRKSDLWRIHHYNGTLLYVPVNVMREEDVSFLKSVTTKKH